MTGDDIPRDPWGNPVPEGVRPPTAPPRRDEPVPPPAPTPAPTPPTVPTNPAWPGRDRAGIDTSSSPPPPPSGGWPDGAWPPPPPQQRPRTAGTAIASLVCGIASIVCVGVLGLVLGPTAIGLGLGARRSIAGSNGWRTGYGLATAGIVCGIVGTILGAAYLVFLIRNPDFLTDLLNDLTTTTTRPGNLQGA